MEHMELDENTSVAELLAILSSRHGPRFRDLAYMNSESKTYLVKFLVEKRMVDDDYIIKDGDEVTILLAFGGG